MSTVSPGDYLPLVHEVARSFAGVPLELDDLVSMGSIGLMDAVARYDATAGSFAAFARQRIRGAILDGLREHDHLSRDHRRDVKAGKKQDIRNVSADQEDETGRTILDSLGSEESATETVERLERVRILRVATWHLPAHLRAVVRESAAGRTLREIGDARGVTESRACQMLSEAQQKLRRIMSRASVQKEARSQGLRVSLCECGCGDQVLRYRAKYAHNECRVKEATSRSHTRRAFESRAKVKLCACGCEQRVPWARNGVRRFIEGHREEHDKQLQRLYTPRYAEKKRAYDAARYKARKERANAKG